MAQSKFDAAIEKYTHVLSMQPSQEEAFICYRYRSFCRYTLEQHELALEDLDRCINSSIARFPAHLLYMRALILKEMGKTEECLDCLQQFIAHRNKPLLNAQCRLIRDYILCGSYRSNIWISVKIVCTCVSVLVHHRGLHLAVSHLKCLERWVSDFEQR